MDRLKKEWFKPGPFKARAKESIGTLGSKVRIVGVQIASCYCRIWRHNTVEIRFGRKPQDPTSRPKSPTLEVCSEMQISNKQLD